jgi:Uma2 family endonuclease
MSTSARQLHYTYAEYLDLEERSSVRHEYMDGEIYAMAGGTPDHAALAAAVAAVLRPVLAPGCRTFSSDLRVRILASGLSTYPDVSVVCGKTERAPDDVHAVTNPVIVVEVTSSSTEDYDRGEKLRHYKLIPSVREVLVVAHREPRIEVHRREPSGEWRMHAAVAGDTIELTSVAARISVADVYRDGLEDV